MRSSRAVALSIACMMIGASAASEAQYTVDGFAARTLVGSNGMVMPYRLFIPDEKKRTQPLPAIIYLHGAGGIGTDNFKQIAGGNSTGTHLWVTPEMQARHSAFVIAPQMAPGNVWDNRRAEGLAPSAQLVIELLEQLSREFAIDRNRIYVTGQSLGGYGTWDLITKRPDLFAAAVPLCGIGTPSRASAVRDMPIWVFHGAKDDLVPVTASREMVAALKAVGSTVRYTEYADVGHGVWERAYAEPELPNWLFAQRRKAR
jgi:predicted peptidase